MQGVGSRMKKSFGKTRLYHRTDADAARAILREGFRDAEGRWGMTTKSKLRGVWVADRPLDGNDGAKEGPLLVIDIDLPLEQLDYWECKEKGKGFREWLIPARILNPHSRVRLDPRG